MPLTRDTHYARAVDGTYLAYQVVGEGPIDIALDFNPDESNVDLMWDEPDVLPYLTGIAQFGRLILHDRRATGASSRNVPPPNLETRVSDLLRVLDEVGSTTPVLLAGREPGAMHTLFAATHPDRVSGLVWNGPAARIAWAPDYPWGEGPEAFEREMAAAVDWGTNRYALEIARVRAAERAGVPYAERDRVPVDPALVELYARINRNTASPDVALEMTRMWWQTDVRSILPAVQAPAALIVGEGDAVDEARYVTSLMPNATLHVLPGRSGLGVEPLLEILKKLAGVESRHAELDTILATVLFTDIVGSTAKQAALGDRAWKHLIVAHHAAVREELQRWRGVEQDTAGDGFFATFDGPARAIRCALEIVERVRPLGIEVRAGVHTGECEVVDEKASGIAVTTGARIAAQAGPSQVLVSQTVSDLVAGSGLSLEPAGRSSLKGLVGARQLYAATRQS